MLHIHPSLDYFLIMEETINKEKLKDEGLALPWLPHPTFSGPFRRGHTSKATDHCFITVSGGTRGPAYINDTGVTDSQVFPPRPHPQTMSTTPATSDAAREECCSVGNPTEHAWITSACLLLPGNKDSGKEGDWLRTKEKWLYLRETQR